MSDESEATGYHAAAEPEPLRGPSDIPTATHTSQCVLCERFVPGTDGDGLCPSCAAGPTSEESAPLAEEPPAEPEEPEEPEVEPAPADGVAEGSTDSSPIGGETPAEVQATPAAVKRAAELGIDLATVTGTGAEGRVTMADVDAAAAGGAPPAP